MRFEYKYIAPVSIINSLRASILPLIEADKFAARSKQNQYTVRSVYLDTPRYDYYFEKIDGVKNRKKVRIRGYASIDNEAHVFLEIKRKYDLPIIKYRVPFLFSEIDDLLAGKYPVTGFDGELSKETLGNLNRFLYQVFSKNLRPVVMVVYEREAYLSKFDQSVRITFDKDLRGSAYPSVGGLFVDKDFKYVMEDNFILEVKFNRHFPGWLRPVLAKYGLKKRSASKYVMCMDRCGVPGDLRKSTLFTKSIWNN